LLIVNGFQDNENFIFNHLHDEKYILIVQFVVWPC
jgi:hypothetical protein